MVSPTFPLLLSNLLPNPSKSLPRTFPLVTATSRRFLGSPPASHPLSPVIAEVPHSFKPLATYIWFNPLFHISLPHRGFAVGKFVAPFHSPFFRHLRVFSIVKPAHAAPFLEEKISLLVNYFFFGKLPESPKARRNSSCLPKNRWYILGRRRFNFVSFPYTATPRLSYYYPTYNPKVFIVVPPILFPPYPA